MNDEKMTPFKLTLTHLAALYDLGNGNATEGIRQAAAAWDTTGRPELPADDARRVRGKQLIAVTKRLDAATIARLRLAGDGNLSRGVRRLALWVREGGNGAE